MNRKIKFSPECFYHIYNRGVEKRNIFLDDVDYQRFLVLLYLCNSTQSIDIRELFPKVRPSEMIKDLINVDRGETLVDIGAYCLMPNHFHLLIREKDDNGITTFMKKLSTAYAMYFNKKNNRSGGLFQGKFGAEFVDKDEYLKYLFAYIHLNPIKLVQSSWKEEGINNKDKARDFLDRYTWSSYNDYSQRRENLTLNKNNFPEYFEKISDFNDFIDFWLSFSENDLSQGPTLR